MTAIRCTKAPTLRTPTVAIWAYWSGRAASLALLTFIASATTPVSAEDSAETLRLRDLFQVAPSEEPPTGNRAGTPARGWTTWHPDAPPVVIPPIEWFLESPAAEESTTADLEAILSRLMEGSDGEMNFTLRGLGAPRDASAVRRREQSPVEEVGRSHEAPRGFISLHIDNGFQRHATEVSFVPEEEDSEAITLILPPGTSENLTLPSGHYGFRRRTWNPMSATPISIHEEFTGRELRDEWSYEWVLRPQDEERIGRDIERAQPVNWSADL